MSQAQSADVEGVRRTGCFDEKPSGATSANRPTNPRRLGKYHATESVTSQEPMPMRRTVRQAPERLCQTHGSVSIPVFGAGGTSPTNRSRPVIAIAEGSTEIPPPGRGTSPKRVSAGAR
jgi:hypothetical protein